MTRFSFLALILATTLAPGAARAGDCVINKVSNPDLRALFKQAAGGKSRVSNRFGNGFELCRADAGVSPNEAQLRELVRTSFTYSLSDGDHKCGYIFPHDLIEQVSTQKLKKTYEDYVRDDVRIWVTSPNRPGVILSQPVAAEIEVPQSVHDCMNNGPDGFACAKGKARIKCCRQEFKKRMMLRLAYPHPFIPGAEIVVMPEDRKVTVTKDGARLEQLTCDAGIRYF
jgi:hypothetical protein